MVDRGVARRAASLAEAGTSGATETKPAGRTCAWDGCPTRLSIYNLGDRCGVHEMPTWTPRRDPPRNGCDRTESGQFLPTLEELT